MRASLRASRLQRFTSSLSRALTTEAVYDVALGEGRELLGADAGLVALPVEGSAEVELVATYGFSDEETAPWRRFPLSPRTPIGEAIERGRPIFIDEGQRESLFPDVEGRGAATASVPLRVADETLGALGFRFARGHVFDDDEREFAVTMGEQCAYALERARVYDAERRGRGALGLLAAIGEQLARSLEPDAALRTLADLVVPALADQCIVDIVVGDDVRRLVVVNADPEVHEAAAHARALPAPALERHARRRRDPHRRAAGGRIDRRPAGQRLPQPRAPHRGGARRDPHDARDAAARARTNARRADLRVAVGDTARRGSAAARPRRSRGASRSRSTTARSTRRRTASASAWPRSYGSCRSA